MNLEGFPMALTSADDFPDGDRINDLHVGSCGILGE